jgi:hypothetical protein
MLTLYMTLSYPLRSCNSSASFDRVSKKGALLQLEKAKFETKIALFSNREVLEDEVSDICQVINMESSLSSQSPTIVLRIFHTMK